MNTEMMTEEELALRILIKRTLPNIPPTECSCYAVGRLALNDLEECRTSKGIRIIWCGACGGIVRIIR